MKAAIQSARKQTTTGGLTLLRVGTGIIMVAHGSQKLGAPQQWQAQVEGLGMPLPALSAWLAIAGEFLGGLGLIVGLLTPIAAFGVACVMLTAILTVHLGNGLFAMNNGWEHPAMIMLVALYFIVRGGGPWSFDAAWQRFRQQRRQSGEGHHGLHGARAGA